jgi:hypothetical protein
VHEAVVQMCVTIPGPVRSAIVRASPGSGCLLSSFQSGSEEFDDERCAVKSLSWEKPIGSMGPVIDGWARAAEASSRAENSGAQKVFRIRRS